jgi:hypothetical protein
MTTMVMVVVVNCPEFRRQTRPFAHFDIQLHRLCEVFHLFTSLHPKNSP